jgi:hypothetical protein
MQWFRKSFLCLSAACLGVAAVAQEPNGRPATAPPGNTSAATQLPPLEVKLGRPTLLGADEAAPGAFVPIRTGTTNTGIRQTSYWQGPPSTIVRASSGVLDDEPKMFLPKDLAPIEDPSSPAIGPPPALFPGPGSVDSAARAVQAVQPVPPKDKAKIIEIDKDGKLFVVPDPPTLSAPPHPDASAGLRPSTCQCNECTGLTDDNGTSMFGVVNWGKSRLYGETDYLFWWTKGFFLPPLVTTASPFDPLATRGALGFGTTQVIYGNNYTTSAPDSGGRFTVGFNLDSCGICALEATYFFLGGRTDTFVANSSQYPVIARPFFDLNDGVQSRQLTTTPALVAGPPGTVPSSTGSLTVSTSSQLWGMELNARSQLWSDCGFKLTGLFGFRYLDLGEGLSMAESILQQNAVVANPGTLPINPGDHDTVLDQFNTHNRFYGGQFGINAEWQRGPWSVNGLFKIAFGATDQSVDINGSQTVLSASGIQHNFVGGLYALPSNIGNHSQTRFAVVPETCIKIGYDINDHVRVFVAYDFMYWSSVVRPGQQVDQVLDLNQVPNANGPFPPANQIRPIVPFQTTGFWAQGVTAGIEFRY